MFSPVFLLFRLLDAVFPHTYCKRSFQNHAQLITLDDQVLKICSDVPNACLGAENRRVGSGRHFIDFRSYRIVTLIYEEVVL